MSSFRGSGDGCWKGGVAISGGAGRRSLVTPREEGEEHLTSCLNGLACVN